MRASPPYQVNKTRLHRQTLPSLPIAVLSPKGFGVIPPQKPVHNKQNCFTIGRQDRPGTKHPKTAGNSSGKEGLPLLLQRAWSLAEESWRPSVLSEVAAWCRAMIVALQLHLPVLRHFWEFHPSRKSPYLSGKAPTAFHQAHRNQPQNADLHGLLYLSKQINKFPMQ